MNRLLVLILLAALAMHWFPEGSVELGPGALAPEQPYQSTLAQAAPLERSGYRITPIANFSLTSKVLSKERYYLGREADLSPIDLALGWGPMSDEQVLEHIEISQSGRWYHWRADQLPIPRREIERNSANMHMIPADENIADDLDDARVGEVLQLQGKLVRVDADDGWRWISSTSREDTGAGACEIFYLEKIERLR